MTSRGPGSDSGGNGHGPCTTARAVHTRRATRGRTTLRGMAEKMNVESFNLDHRAGKAPYIRVADRQVLPGGDVLVKYDLRFTQPNQGHLEMPTIHSLEHSVAERIRDHADYVLDFSPMGCQTGFYLMVHGEHTDEEIHELVAAALRDVLELDEVPAANEVQCGWGASHSLTGAKDEARRFLSKKDEWSEVMA